MFPNLSGKDQVLLLLIIIIIFIVIINIYQFFKAARWLSLESKWQQLLSDFSLSL